MLKILKAAVLTMLCAFTLSPQSADAAGNTQWKLLRVLNYNDADVAVAAVTATITVPLAISGGLTEIEDFAIDVPTAFAWAADAGNQSTLLCDIGKSGSLEKYTKDLSIKTATTASPTLGSETTSVKPRHIEPRGTPVVITLTSNVANLSLLTAGQARIWVKVGAGPVR
jgi:hypothetical protein